MLHCYAHACSRADPSIELPFWAEAPLVITLPDASRLKQAKDNLAALEVEGCRYMVMFTMYISEES